MKKVVFAKGVGKEDDAQRTLRFLPIPCHEQQFSTKDLNPSQFKSNYSISNDVKELLKNDESLEFDTFLLRTLTNNDEAAVIMVNLFEKHGLLGELGIVKDKFVRLARRLQAGYNENPYHNQTHSADVAQVKNTLKILSNKEKKFEYFGTFEQFYYNRWLSTF